MPGFKVVLALAAVLVPMLISHFVGGWVAVYTSGGFSVDQIPNLSGKLAIVTGGNTGIGKITVRDLALKGATVILTSRSTSKGQSARKEVCDYVEKMNNRQDCPVIVLPLDLASLDSVLSFANHVASLYSHVDILVLNAGIMFGEFAVTEQGYERQWGTNHLGHFFLTERLMPLLTTAKTEAGTEAGTGARVVTVSSGAHKHPYGTGIAFDQLDNSLNYDPFKAYGQSKLSNILFARELSDRFSSAGIISNSLHPGVIKTELMRHANSGITALLPSSLSSLLLWLEDVVFNVLFMTADQGALTQLYVATAPELANVTGQFFKPVGVQAAPSAHARDVVLQRRLWEESARLTAAFLQSKDLEQQKEWQ